MTMLSLAAQADRWLRGSRWTRFVWWRMRDLGLRSLLVMVLAVSAGASAAADRASRGEVAAAVAFAHVPPAVIAAFHRPMIWQWIRRARGVRPGGRQPRSGRGCRATETGAARGVPAVLPMTVRRGRLDRVAA